MGILIFVRFIMSCKVPSPSSFLGKVFGRLRPLIEVLFFVWAAAWNKIVTGENLKIRGFAFVDWCVMCNCCGEIVNHLLLHCEKAHKLWCFFFFDPLGTRGFYQKRYLIFFWLVELVGEALIIHLEFSFVAVDVVYMEGV